VSGSGQVDDRMGRIKREFEATGGTFIPVNKPTEILPGVWLTGNAMRLLERTNPGVLHADLVACNSYAGGLVAAAKVRCPVLVIDGSRDIMAPPKNARELIGALRGARVVDLPECGHAMMAEQPDAVLDALRTFV